MVGILQSIIDDAKIAADEKVITDAQRYVDDKAFDAKTADENLTSLTEFLEGKFDIVSLSFTTGAKAKKAADLVILNDAIAYAKLYINPVELRTLKTKELTKKQTAVISDDAEIV